MRSTIFTSALALACAVLPVRAEQITTACYARQYSAKHLATHPDQVVAEMRLRFYDWDGGAYADLDILTADQGHARANGQGGQRFDQFLLCFIDSEGAPGCAVECDGGSFRITRDDGEVMDIRTDYLMVGDTEGCGGAIDLAEKPDQAVTYRLYRVGDDTCETE